MLSILITFLTLVLILICIIMVTAILMQRASTDAGMGAAMGGGAAESAFGADAVNVLTKATKWSALAFFVVAFGLYLLHMSQHTPAQETDEDAPLEFEDETAPAATEDTGTLQQEGVFTPDDEAAPESTTTDDAAAVTPMPGTETAPATEEPTPATQQ
ncbi:MAG: preprotein translocase subunit SecG [Puniceicoccaceae bacterium 5H]|nr:MAG: preprotein translocase subunit SecG [Puniceicoccaceae bacterium 5H]